MNSSYVRNHRGWGQQDALLLAGLLAAGYFGTQYFIVYKEPNKLVNNDYVCNSRGGVLAFQNPRMLVQYMRASGITARLASPDKAQENESVREGLGTQMVDLDANTPNTLLTERRNPLVVHVLDTDYSQKDSPVLRVRVLNKTHKGETWYIAATSVNPLLKVNGAADKVAKLHKPGVDDLMETPAGTKVIKAISDRLNKQQ